MHMCLKATWSITHESFNIYIWIEYIFLITSKVYIIMLSSSLQVLMGNRLIGIVVIFLLTCASYIINVIRTFFQLKTRSQNSMVCKIVVVDKQNGKGILKKWSEGKEGWVRNFCFIPLVSPLHSSYLVLCSGKISMSSKVPYLSLWQSSSLKWVLLFWT